MNSSVRTQKQLTTATVLMICLLAALAAQDAPSGAPDAGALIRQAENLMYPAAKVAATLTFDDGKGRRDSYGMVFYTKERNQKIIVRFTAPAAQVGNDILMIEQNVWAYDKRSNRVMKIPSNQSFGGTGFSYGDVVRLNFSDNYDAKVTGSSDKEWLLELNAKDRNAPYFRIVLSIDKAGGWPVKGTCYAKSGTVVKEMVYGGVKDAGAGKKPLTLTVTSPANPGETTVMTLSREESKDLPDRIFNKRNLETRLEENL
jgi:outer membrane lipoprotein-sorting protein